MSRPKKGEPGCEAANSKWRESMLKKYGGEEALREMMRQRGRLGGRNGRGEDYQGGFACKQVGADGMTGRERSRVAGAKGGRISRRRKKKVDADGGRD